MLEVIRGLSGLPWSGSPGLFANRWLARPVLVFSTHVDDNTGGRFGPSGRRGASICTITVPPRVAVPCAPCAMEVLPHQGGSQGAEGVVVGLRS